MRTFLEPQKIRKVALLILICWFMPFLGVMGAMAFSPPGEEDQGLYAKDPAQTGSKNSRDNIDLDVTIKPSREDTDQRKQSSAQNGNNTPQPNRSGEVNQEDAHGTTNGGESRSTARKNNENTHTYTYASTYANNNNAQTNARPQATTSSAKTTQNANLNLLARVIHAEARGEPLEGQVAVGAVLLNRLESPRFPNNLWGIIFKRGEFCTVRDGQVWMNPNSQAYKAARLALAGWDPTHGALYFYNPAKTTSKWIWSRPVTTRIGSHIFAR